MHCSCEQHLNCRRFIEDISDNVDFCGPHQSRARAAGFGQADLDRVHRLLGDSSAYPMQFAEGGVKWAQVLPVGACSLTHSVVFVGFVKARRLAASVGGSWFSGVASECLSDHPRLQPSVPAASTPLPALTGVAFSHSHTVKSGGVCLWGMGGRCSSTGVVDAGRLVALSAATGLGLGKSGIWKAASPTDIRNRRTSVTERTPARDGTGSARDGPACAGATNGRARATPNNADLRHCDLPFQRVVQEVAREQQLPEFRVEGAAVRNERRRKCNITHQTTDHIAELIGLYLRRGKGGGMRRRGRGNVTQLVQAAGGL